MFNFDLEEDQRRIKEIESIIFKHETIDFKRHIKIINNTPYLYTYTHYKGRTDNNNPSYDWQSLGRIEKEDYMKYHHNRINRDLADDLKEVSEELEERIDIIATVNSTFNLISKKERDRILKKQLRHLKHIDKSYESKMRLYNNTIKQQGKIIETYKEIEEQKRLKDEKKAM